MARDTISCTYVTPTWAGRAEERRRSARGFQRPRGPAAFGSSRGAGRRCSSSARSPPAPRPPPAAPPAGSAAPGIGCAPSAPSASAAALPSPPARVLFNHRGVGEEDLSAQGLSVSYYTCTGTEVAGITFVRFNYLTWAEFTSTIRFSRIRQSLRCSDPRDESDRSFASGPLVSLTTGHKHSFRFQGLFCPLS